MNRPSPRPRPKPAADNTITEKSPSERLTGVADKPAAAPRTQITYHESTYVRAETPIGFEAATFCKTGVDLAPGEQSAVSE